jgi:hypothetical protein
MPLPGIDPKEYEKIADALGIEPQWIWDLAKHSEEIRMTLSVAHVLVVARITGLSMSEILGSPMPESVEPVAPGALRDLLFKAVEAAGCSLDEFGCRIGWDVESLVERPESLLEIYNWDGLVDVCAAVDLSPWSVVLGVGEGVVKGLP